MRIPSRIINISFLKKFVRLVNRTIRHQSTSWLDRTEPFSRNFGLDRGQAIDRRFIEHFLTNNSSFIRGNVLEVGDDRYMTRYGSNMERLIVLAGQGMDSRTESYVGDLTNIDSLPFAGDLDCVIATNVLSFIFDIDAAVHGLATLINPSSGFVLVTVPGVCQISRFDYNRWGDYWRFTDMSIRRVFEKYFYNVEVHAYGNAPLAAAFIMGIAQEEVPDRLFECFDHDYQILIAVKASSPR